MKSQRKTAASTGTRPVPRSRWERRRRHTRSGFVSVEKAVVTATPPAATEVTPPISATLRAQRVPGAAAVDGVGDGGGRDRSHREPDERLAEAGPCRV